MGGSTISEADDETLAARAQRGDDAAFAALVRRYEQPLYAYAHRMLHNAADAEDVFQETFLRVHRRFLQFDSTRLFKPWLYRIATNVCRDRQRSWWRQPTVALTELPMAPVDPGPGPDAVAIMGETQKRLEQAVARLPDKQRAVFLLARYEDMPYDQIAVALGIPVGTVKSRMNKAVTFLRERMRIR